MNKALAGIIASGIVVGTLWADSITNVYSVNAVGYVRMDVQAGQFYMIGVPLNVIGGGGVTISDLLGTAGCPEGTLAYVYNGQGYAIEEMLDGAWDPGTNTVQRGKGFWLKPSEQATINLSGEVPGKRNSATTTTELVEGFQMLCFPYPVSVNLDNAGMALSASEGDTIYLWNGGYSIHEFIDGLWDPAITDLAVGQGFWYKRNSTGAVSWNEDIPYNL